MRAREQKYRYYGGKQDDITVIVALIKEIKSEDHEITRDSSSSSFDSVNENDNISENNKQMENMKLESKMLNKYLDNFFTSEDNKNISEVNKKKNDF